LLCFISSAKGKGKNVTVISVGIEIDTEVERALTVQMLEEGTTRSILEDHHSCERLATCAVTKQVQQVLMVHSGQNRYLKQELAVNVQ
jgi:hypothetical protein